MYHSFFGTIIEITSDSIAVEVNGVAYSLLVSNPDKFPYGEPMRVYAYEVYGENDHYLVGFANKEEKESFLSLISVKGIGPKTALGALSATTPEELAKAISSGNTSYLKKLPGIGAKAASQIILDLKGRLTGISSKKEDKKYDEAKEALKTLGYKSKDIDAVLASINEPDLDTEGVIKLALKSMKGK